MLYSAPTLNLYMNVTSLPCWDDFEDYMVDYGFCNLDFAHPAGTIKSLISSHMMCYLACCLESASFFAFRSTA